MDGEENAERVFSLPFLRSNLERSKDAGTWQEGGLLPQTGTISIKCPTVPQSKTLNICQGS